MFKHIGLKTKILGLVSLPAICLIIVFVFISYWNKTQFEKDYIDARSVAANIAFASTINKQKQNLEKQSLNFLDAEEITTFLQDNTDSGSKMVVEGLFLSLKEEGIIRATLYDKNFRSVSQQVENVSKRTRDIPSNLQPVFLLAAEDFETHFYFRGTEKEPSPIATEYCAVTSVYDDDDNPIGYVELALNPSIWVKEIAELTQQNVLLFDQQSKSFTTADRPETLNTLAGFATDTYVPEAPVTQKMQKNYWALFALPVYGVDNTPTSFLVFMKNANATKAAERTRFFIAAGLALAIVVLSLAGAFLVASRGIVAPIHRIIDFAEQMATGDYSTTLEIKCGGDIGQMRDALNKMVQHIQQRSKEANTIAGGDLSIAITTKSENDILGKALQDIISSLSKIFDAMRENGDMLFVTVKGIDGLSSKLSSSSEDINNQTASLGESFTTVINNLQMAAGATEEMSASIKEISQNTEENGKLAIDTKKHAEVASNVIKELSTAVESISRANQSITDFADQTNLLALNATIEAARAGEAGRGFAVVASEVKDLANQSMQTAKQVSKDILIVSNLTQNAVKAAEEINREVEAASGASEGIAAAIEEQTVVAGDISGNVAGAFSLTHGFSETIDGINATVNNNNIMVNSLNEASQALSEIADQLHATVGKFKLSS